MKINVTGEKELTDTEEAKRQALVHKIANSLTERDLNDRPDILVSALVSITSRLLSPGDEELADKAYDRITAEIARIMVEFHGVRN